MEHKPDTSHSEDRHLWPGNGQCAHGDLGPTSIRLSRESSVLKPGILFSLQTTPTSSVCLQSDTPQPLELQEASEDSLPVQWTLSSQILPAEEGTGGLRGSSCPPVVHTDNQAAPTVVYFLPRLSTQQAAPAGSGCNSVILS